MLMQHIHTINLNKILPFLYQNGLIILYSIVFELALGNQKKKNQPQNLKTLKRTCLHTWYATYFKDNAWWSYIPYTLGLGRSHSEAGFIFLTVMRVDLGVLGAVGGAAS